MADDAIGVMDAPEVGVDAEPIESTPDLGAEPDGGAEPSGEPGEGGEPAAESGAPADIDKSPAIIDGKRLSEGTRKALEPIKAANPALHKQLIHALFQADRLKRDFPGGFNEIDQLRTSLEEMGGSEGITQTRAELQRWDDFDQKFTKGDPAFIEELAGDPQSQEAFLKLVPAAIQKFASLHPEGYKNYIGRVVVGDLSANGVPLMMERMQDFISDNPRAMEVWQRLAGYLNGWNELATKAVETPKLAAPQAPGGREQELAAREHQLMVRDWSGASNSSRMDIFTSHWDRLTAGMKLSGEQQADIKELYVARLGKALAADGFTEKAKRFVQAGDRDGYLRLAKSMYEKNIPAVLSAVISRAVPARKQGGSAAQPPRVNGAPPNGKVEAGFAWVGKTPESSAINWRQTTASMVAQGKYVLNDGRKVQCHAGL